MLKRKNRFVAAVMSLVLGMMLVAKPNPVAGADAFCGYTYDFEMIEPTYGNGHGVISPGAYYTVVGVYGYVNTHPETITGQWTSDHTFGLFGNEYHWSCS